MNPTLKNYIDNNYKQYKSNLSMRMDEDTRPLILVGSDKTRARTISLFLQINIGRAILV